MFQNIDQQNELPTSSHFVDEDEVFESCNKSPFHDSRCDKNEKDFDSIEYSNMYGNNNLKTLKTINTTSIGDHSSDNCDNKLIKANNSIELSQISQTENKYFIAICGSINANINSQEEKIIMNMVKKNIKHILPLSAELTDMNTQHFMDLNLHRAIHHLQGTQEHEDISEKQSVEIMESEDSDFFTPLSTKSPSDTSINSKHSIKNVISVSELKKSEELKNTFSTNYVELSNQIDDELMNQEEDSEIINFRAMCEAMTKIGTIDKQVKHNSSSHTMVQNQMKNIVLEKVTGDVLIVNDDEECVPVTNKLISPVDSNRSSHNGDIFKRKRHHCYSPTLNLFSDSSPEYSNELSQKHMNNENKKTKLTSLQNSSSIQSKSCSKKIENKSDKISMNSSEDEEDCMHIKNQLFKVNHTEISYKHKSIHTDSSDEQNKISIGKEHMFYCSPNGLIHRDMINYMYQKSCIKK